ncbi:ABC transporter permease [Poritiphilus flavus]|uniref:FtsX-like permease family protein n=1 Tax=Poritiphilus flavus TaxID=2697053 RepID=A0A6L9EF92_9FLAO|nr:ABC transporter permease [Poritiphilus flavus]NAS13323.1 FtsX-like permease family protein [Poritiphilus flavus]
MLKNYLKTAWRNLKRNKVYAMINIGGLAAGITVVMLIGLWIHDELSYNTYHQNYDRIAQVLVNRTSNGQTRTRYTMPYPLGNELRNVYGSNFEYVVMSSFHGDNVLSIDEKNKTTYGSYMEEDALRMLSLEMLDGSWDAIQEPNSIVISNSTAQAFFGDSDPMGKPMKINNKQTVTVTGVFKDLPYNSHFRELKFIAPWKLYVETNDWVRVARDENQWDNNSYQLFVQISPEATMQTTSENIKSAVFNNVSENARRSKPEIFLHQMKDWHLRSEWKNGVQTNGFVQYVWLFGIIGIFVLVLACINFMNLATAQSVRRAKEVGVRKTIGSNKNQLINQFLTESLLLSFFALSIAGLLVYILLPSFNQLADKQIVFPFTNPVFWLLCLALLMATSVLAGSYPAIYLSSFRPAKVLKGTFKTGKATISSRKALVVFQFTISIILVIGTIVIDRQIQFFKDRPTGYERDQLLMIPKNTEDFEGKYNLIREELVQNEIVQEMSESSSPLTEVWSGTSGIEWEGKDPALATNFVTVCVTHDYGNTIGWEILEGRDFSRDFASDSTAFILNEAAVDYMGLKDPVGKTIRWGRAQHKVIGVVKNILTESPYESIKQSIYLIKYDNTNWIELKLLPNRSISESLAQIGAVFKKHAPNVPFEYQFVDEAFSTKFKAEERIRELSGIFAFLAIFISCLGLFGLASFVAEQRTKEIGVRKVLGASVLSLWQMLSGSFVVLVLISGLIAIPIAYHLMKLWLQNYEYSVEIRWWIFAVTIIGALLITVITVSFQALKAANINPVKSLRAE